MKAHPYLAEKAYSNGDQRRINFRFNERDMQQGLLDLRAVDNIDSLPILKGIKEMLEFYLRSGIFGLTKEYRKGDHTRVRKVVHKEDTVMDEERSCETCRWGVKPPCTSRVIAAQGDDCTNRGAWLPIMSVEEAIAMLKECQPRIAYDPTQNKLSITNLITEYQAWEIAAILKSQAATIQRLEGELNVHRTDTLIQP